MATEMRWRHVSAHLHHFEDGCGLKPSQVPHAVGNTPYKDLVLHGHEIVAHLLEAVASPQVLVEELGS